MKNNSINITFHMHQASCVLCIS